MDTKGWKETLHHDLDQLTALRDELRVQAHLAKAELTTELDQLETRWLHIKDEVKRITEESSLRTEVETRARGVIDELKRSYLRIKQELKM